MKQTLDLELYDLLKDKLGEVATRGVIHYVHHKVEDELTRSKHFLATREDVKNLETKLENRIIAAQTKIMWAIGFSVPIILSVVIYIIDSQGQRITGLDQRMGSLEQRMEKKLDQIDARFEKIDARFEKIDARFEKIDEKLEKMNEKINQIFLLLEKNNKR